MGAMRSLESLFLDQNELTGTIPVSLTNLTKRLPEPLHLRRIDTSATQLS
jgi:hypothetical protein